MAELRPRRAGWHPDPSDPTSVRHWDGQGWERVRNRPAWSLCTGELVVDTAGIADPTRPGGPPVLEGPVRPAPERAATAALNVGREPRGPAGPSTPLRPRATVTGPAAGQYGPRRLAGPPGTGSWTGSRRPFAILGLMVVAAIVALTAIVGWAGPRSVNPGPLPSAFVSQAAQSCARQLGVRPAELPTDSLAITVQDQQLSAMEADLRNLAIVEHANFQANTWLATWQRFLSTEQQRAAALGQPGGGSSSTLTLLANDAAAQADGFAAANGLSSCSILATSPARIESIPS